MNPQPTESPNIRRHALLAGVLLITLFSIGLTACSEFKYYKQAVSGQFDLLYHRRAIDDVVNDPKTEPHVKRQLQLIQAIRQYARKELALPSDEAYNSYVDIGRPYVVWNVFASKPLAFESKHWCYLVIGCQTYRGYFDLEMAKKDQDKLQDQGWETWLGGVSAYSTLGWFEDPVLSTFLKRDDTGLAALIFHELSHHVVYVKGDTTFNESFATAFEQFAVKQWLIHQGKTQEIKSYMLRFQAQNQFVSLVSDTIMQLKTVYQSTMTETAKRDSKQQILNDLPAKALIRAKQYPQLTAYLPWFNQQINNAKLMTVASYHQKVPEFSAMLNDFIDSSRTKKEAINKFFNAVRQLADMSREQRDTELKHFLESAKKANSTF